MNVTSFWIYQHRPKNYNISSRDVGPVYLQSHGRKIPEIFVSHIVMVFHVFLSQWHDATSMTKKILSVITLWWKSNRVISCHYLIQDLLLIFNGLRECLSQVLSFWIFWVVIHPELHHKYVRYIRLWNYLNTFSLFF